mgnify:CR=1 FL=1
MLLHHSDRAQTARRAPSSSPCCPPTSPTNDSHSPERNHCSHRRRDNRRLFDFADEDADDETYFECPEDEPWSDLLACSLTSQAFLGPARARLYHTALVEVETSPAYARLVNPNRAIWHPERELLISMEQALEATVTLNPHLAAYVREIHITFGDRACPALLIPTLAMSHLLRTCPLVHTLTLGSEGAAETPTGHFNAILDVESEALAAVLMACRPTLSTVDLFVANFESSAGKFALVNAVIQLPSLRSLRLGRQLFPGTGPGLPMQETRAALDSLVLYQEIGTDDQLLAALTSSSRASLRSLTIYQYSPLFTSPTPALLPDLSTLTSLAALGWSFHYEHDPGSSATRESLSQLRSLPLTSLRLSNRSDTAEAGDLVDDLSFLPPILRRVEIPLPQPDTLARIIMDDRYVDLTDYTLHSADDARADAWTPFTLGALRAACQHRGFRIECDGTLM